VLYGLAQAKGGIRRENQIGIVEGYTDAIVAHQAGLDYFVAGLGTAFTRENARSLRRLARRVLIVFDGDSAGQLASERSLDLLVDNDLDVRIHTLEAGKDPCDMILLLGGEEFRRRLDSETVGIFEFKWRRTVEAVPPGDAPSRARALDEFLRLILRLPNPVARKLVLRDFVERLGVSEKDVEKRLEKLSRSAVTPRPEMSPPDASRAAGSRQAKPALEPLAELILECLLALPGKAAELWERVPEGLFAGPVGQALAAAIAAELRESSLSALRLAREIEEPEANRVVIKVLSRLESEVAPVDDYETVWKNCLRDIDRWRARKRLAELEELKARARADRDQEKLQACRLERISLLKDLKRQGGGRN
jgi:DNA primase